MGEVKVNVLIKNYGSAWAARKGFIPDKEVQTSELQMTVDTGAVMILLPQ